MECMFDPFFSTRDTGKGVGMGLSIVHGIIHEWGGHIMVEVVPGTVTCVKLYIPHRTSFLAAAGPQKVTGEQEINNITNEGKGGV